MKIVLICGSLEPGKDGVGDYTRNLAAEVIRNGHQVAALALQDKYITKDFSGFQNLANIAIPVLRLPLAISETDRFEKAKSWINNVNPDVISLQFVIFAYHPKGLPFNLTSLLKKLGNNRQWNIMFHELWVGMAANDTLKRQIWGMFQKFIVRKLIKGLSPKQIHTQCDLYLQQLKKEGFKTKLLPLFSNIEVAKLSSETNIPISNTFTKNSDIKFAVFGGLHADSKLGELIEKLKQYEKNHNKSFEFLYLGRNGGELANHVKVLDREKVKYSILGELTPEEISAFLSISTYGISTGSPEMLGKNGTVAAMIAHKLPVICIGRDLVIKKIPKLTRLDGTFVLEEIEEVLLNRPTINNPVKLSNVANQFINDLQYNN